MESGFESLSIRTSEDTAYDPMPCKNLDGVPLNNFEVGLGPVVHEVESKVDGNDTEICSLKKLSTEDISSTVPSNDATALEEESGDVELGNFFLEDASSGEVLPPEVVKLQKKEKMRELLSAKNLEKLEGFWKKVFALR